MVSRCLQVTGLVLFFFFLFRLMLRNLSAWQEPIFWSFILYPDFSEDSYLLEGQLSTWSSLDIAGNFPFFNHVSKETFFCLIGFWPIDSMLLQILFWGLGSSRKSESWVLEVDITSHHLKRQMKYRMLYFTVRIFFLTLFSRKK